MAWISAGVVRADIADKTAKRCAALVGILQNNIRLLFTIMLVCYLWC